MLPESKSDREREREGHSDPCRDGMRSCKDLDLANRPYSNIHASFKSTICCLPLSLALIVPCLRTTDTKHIHNRSLFTFVFAIVFFNVAILSGPRDSPRRHLASPGFLLRLILRPCLPVVPRSTGSVVELSITCQLEGFEIPARVDNLFPRTGHSANNPISPHSAASNRRCSHPSHDHDHDHDGREHTKSCRVRLEHRCSRRTLVDGRSLLDRLQVT